MLLFELIWKLYDFFVDPRLPDRRRRRLRGPRGVSPCRENSRERRRSPCGLRKTFSGKEKPRVRRLHLRGPRGTPSGRENPRGRRRTLVKGSD